VWTVINRLATSAEEAPLHTPGSIDATLLRVASYGPDEVGLLKKLFANYAEGPTLSAAKLARLLNVRTAPYGCEVSRISTLVLCAFSRFLAPSWVRRMEALVFHPSPHVAATPCLRRHAMKARGANYFAQRMCSVAKWFSWAWSILRGTGRSPLSNAMDFSINQPQCLNAIAANSDPSPLLGWMHLISFDSVKSTANLLGR
jgi:hypothetical protein